MQPIVEWADFGLLPKQFSIQNFFDFVPKGKGGATFLPPKIQKNINAKSDRFRNNREPISHK